MAPSPVATPAEPSAPHTENNAGSPGITGASETVLLTWRVHRLRESPGGLYWIAGTCLAALVLGRIASLPFVTLLFAPLVLGLALADYLLPTTYRLTDKGAHADVGLNRLFIAWKDIRRATHGKEGIFLSPLSTPSRLDSFRGVRLRYSSENAEQVLEVARRLRHPSEEPSRNGAEPEKS